MKKFKPSIITVLSLTLALTILTPSIALFTGHLKQELYIKALELILSKTYIIDIITKIM